MQDWDLTLNMRSLVRVRPFPPKIQCILPESEKKTGTGSWEDQLFRSEGSRLQHVRLVNFQRFWSRMRWKSEVRAERLSSFLYVPQTPPPPLHPSPSMDVWVNVFRLRVISSMFMKIKLIWFGECVWMPECCFRIAHLINGHSWIKSSDSWALILRVTVPGGQTAWMNSDCCVLVSRVRVWKLESGKPIRWILIWNTFKNCQPIVGLSCLWINSSHFGAIVLRVRAKVATWRLQGGKIHRMDFDLLNSSK